MATLIVLAGFVLFVVLSVWKGRDSRPVLDHDRGWWPAYKRPDRL